MLGLKSKRHQDWFDDNDQEIEHLISKKRQTFCAWQKDITCQTKRKAQICTSCIHNHRTEVSAYSKSFKQSSLNPIPASDVKIKTLNTFVTHSKRY